MSKSRRRRKRRDEMRTRRIVSEEVEGRDWLACGCGAGWGWGGRWEGKKGG